MTLRNSHDKNAIIAHNYDVAFKESMRLFEQYVLSFLQIKEDTKIVQNISPESITIEVKKLMADMFFLLNDGSGLNIEWQARITRTDMLRFQSYSVMFMEKYKLQDMQTVILTREKPRVDSITYSSGTFRPLIINLTERNPEEALEKIKKQITAGEEINPLEIIYIGLYNGGVSENAPGIPAARILKETISLLQPDDENAETLHQILSLLFVANRRLLSDKDAKEILEVIRMKWEDSPVMIALQEIFEEEGMAKARTESAARAIQKGLPFEDVAEITGLSLEAVVELAGQTV